MSKDEWFTHYERRLNEFLGTNDRWPTERESEAISKRAYEDVRDAAASLADLHRDIFPDEDPHTGERDPWTPEEEG